MVKRIGIAATFLLLANVSAAQDDDWSSWPMGAKFTIYGNAFFPKLDTVARLDASDGTTGTTVDFEQNLGMSDTETLPAAGFAWRFARKHQVRFDAFNLLRSGSTISTGEIRFGDEVFQIDLPISSYFDTKVRSVAYSYSLVFDERKELALTAGLSIQDIGFGLLGTAGAGLIEESGGITAPLPAFGLSGGYAITDKWVINAGIGYFTFSLSLADEDELSGELITANAALQHHTFEHVHFALGFSFFDVNADFREARRINSLSYRYVGPSLMILGRF